MPSTEKFRTIQDGLWHWRLISWRFLSAQDCPQSVKAWLYWIYSCWFMLFISIFIIRSILSIRNPFTLIFTPLVNPVSTTPRWSQANGLTWASCQPFGWKGTPYAGLGRGEGSNDMKRPKWIGNDIMSYICIVYNSIYVYVYIDVYIHIYTVYAMIWYAMIILRDSWGCGENNGKDWPFWSVSSTVVAFSVIKHGNWKIPELNGGC